MTVIRLDDGRLMLHSPCEIDDHMRRGLAELGEVAYIVAPGTFHYLHVPSAQAAFPEAETFICPGLEDKRPDMHFDWLLGDIAPAAWAGQLDQVLVRGNRWIWEVAFFHRQTRTLILVDLIEKFTDATPHVDWKLKLWWKVVFHMWNTRSPRQNINLAGATRRPRAPHCSASYSGISSESSSRTATSSRLMPGRWSKRPGRNHLPTKPASPSWPLGVNRYRVPFGARADQCLLFPAGDQIADKSRMTRRAFADIHRAIRACNKSRGERTVMLVTKPTRGM